MASIYRNSRTRERTSTARAGDRSRSRSRSRHRSEHKSPNKQSTICTFENRKGNKYRIRWFESKDIDKLQELDVKMTRDLLGDDEEPYGDYLCRITDANRTRFRHYQTIACSTLDTDAAVGFIIFYFVKRKSKKYVELFWIAVDEQYSRQGIAQKLISTMLEEARKKWGATVRTFKLDVMVHNESAIKLYEKIGFVRETKLKRNYPVKGYSAYKYVLKL